LPHGGGAHAKLNEDQLMILTDLAAESPDATSGEPQFRSLSVSPP
jgi:hypothetical protein